MAPNLEAPRKCGYSFHLSAGPDIALSARSLLRGGLALAVCTFAGCSPGDTLQPTLPPAAFVRSFGTSGATSGLFSGPQGVAVAPDGTVYVADSARVERISPAGVPMAPLTGGIQPFVYPSDVAIDGAGNVYVLDGGLVQWFTASGTFLGYIGGCTAGKGCFSFPTSVTVDAEGHIYVTDIGSNQVFKFDPTFGVFINSGSDTGIFFPVGIAVAPNGDVYVSDAGQHRLLKFNSNLSLLDSWELGDPLPTGLAMDDAGNIYVSLNDKIRVFSTRGRPIGEWGTLGDKDGQFNEPQGIAFDRNGHCYVADTGNRRIQEFALLPGLLFERR